jgi:hypothetical protein
MRGKIKKEGLGVLVYFGYCGTNHTTAYKILFMLQLVYPVTTNRHYSSHAGACVRIGLNTSPTHFGPGACGRIVLTTSQSLRPADRPPGWRTTARSATSNIDLLIITRVSAFANESEV